MSWREFMLWQAYLDMEPPDKADNQRLAVLLAQITNMAGKSLPQGKKVKPEDFLGKPKVRQTEAQQKAFFQSLKGSKHGS